MTKKLTIWMLGLIISGGGVTASITAIGDGNTQVWVKIALACFLLLAVVSLYGFKMAFRKPVEKDDWQDL